MFSILQSWLYESFLILLALGGILGVFAGALLVFAPQRFWRLCGRLDRWISVRRMTRNLESSVTLDPWIYRHHYWAGALILAGALFILHFFSTQLVREAAVAALARHFHLPLALMGGLFDALIFSAFLGGVCAAFVALVLLFRPSLLRQFEHNANQWFSLRRALKPLEIPRSEMEDIVSRHTRQTGIFLLLGGLYILALLIWVGAGQ